MVHHAVQTQVPLDPFVKLGEGGGDLGLGRFVLVGLRDGPVGAEVARQTSYVGFRSITWTQANFILVKGEGAIRDAAASRLRRIRLAPAQLYFCNMTYTAWNLGRDVVFVFDVYVAAVSWYRVSQHRS
jgi:hypothetical protein